MKTQCPFCKKIFKAPETYKGRMVRCIACKDNFVVSEYHEPIINPETVEKAKETAKDNIFTTAWKRAPSPFKTGFFATLGVAAGLVVALNVYIRYVNFSTNPPQPYTPLQTSEKLIENTTNFNIDSSGNTFDPYYLAAAIRINQYTSRLQALFNARITAAETYSQKGDLLTSAKVMRCTCLQLEELNTTVSRMRIPNNDEIKTAYRALQAAIQSEYMFQQSLIDITQNPRQEKLDKIKQLSQESVSKFETAMIQAVFVLSQADPSLLEAIVAVDGN